MSLATNTLVAPPTMYLNLYFGGVFQLHLNEVYKQVRACPLNFRIALFTNNWVQFYTIYLLVQGLSLAKQWQC